MNKVGIPKSLFYYYNYPLWFTFFGEIGYKVITTNQTNKNIATKGVQLTVDEVCFPVKTYFGHIEGLFGKVNYIFCPRIVSIEPKAYICPKFMGLPDMVRASFSNTDTKFLTPTISITNNKKEEEKYTFIQMAKELGVKKRLALKAWKQASETQKYFHQLLSQRMTPVEAINIILNKTNPSVDINADINKEKIVIIGHGYNIYDEYLSMNLITKIKNNGFEILTPEMVDQGIDIYDVKLRKKIFWSLGKRIMNSLHYFFKEHKVAGIIYIASFGCGPDSLIEHLADGYASEKNIPFILITVDEHTGEAGINTRLEAFLDMLRRREVN